MNHENRLVYSTEDGQIAKAMNSKVIGPKGKDASTGKKKRKQHQSSAAKIINPNKQGIRICRESKGRGGKSVCVINGLTLDAAVLKKLLKKLKSQLGTGGAIKDDCIEIQGDHRDKILQLLEKEGFKAKLAGG